MRFFVGQGRCGCAAPRGSFCPAGLAACPALARCFLLFLLRLLLLLRLRLQIALALGGSTLFGGCRLYVRCGFGLFGFFACHGLGQSLFSMLLQALVNGLLAQAGAFLAFGLVDELILLAQTVELPMRLLAYFAQAVFYRKALLALGFFLGLLLNHGLTLLGNARVFCSTFGRCGRRGLLLRNAAGTRDQQEAT